VARAIASVDDADRAVLRDAIAAGAARRV
jgi:hypothetical protein